MFLYMVIDDITQLAVTYHCAAMCSPAKMMVLLLHNIGFNVSTLLKWNEMFIFFTYTSARIHITDYKHIVICDFICYRRCRDI